MIYIIGIGIDGRASLSDYALSLIDKASVLVGGRRHVYLFPEFKGRALSIRADINGLIKELKEALSPEGDIVVLATGDPNFFGIADSIVRVFGKKIIRIIPNTTTMQEAFARIKEHWGDAKFLSLHGRTAAGISVQSQGDEAKGLMENIADEIAACNKVGIFTDPRNTPSKIAKMLLNRGIKGYKVYVCEALGTEEEKITVSDLRRIARKSFLPLNVMILIRNKGAGGQGFKSNLKPSHHASCGANGVIFGIPDREFSHSKGMITKEEVRVISLSKLKLRNDSIVWDIGAGSGSLSIEAAMLAVNGRVFAIERERSRIRHIERNKKKFKAGNIEIVRRSAPDGLKKLPAPDAIFIGGGGSDINKILQTSSMRIKSGGRIVVNAVTIETLLKVTGFFRRLKWKTEIVSVTIAKTKEIRALHLFNSYNPVFIVTGEKI